MGETLDPEPLNPKPWGNILRVWGLGLRGTRPNNGGSNGKDNRKSNENWLYMRVHKNEVFDKVQNMLLRSI